MSGRKTDSYVVDHVGSVYVDKDGNYLRDKEEEEYNQRAYINQSNVLSRVYKDYRRERYGD